MLKNKQQHNIIVWNDTKRISDNFPFKKAVKYKLEDITCDPPFGSTTVKVFHHTMLEVLGTAIEAGFNPLTIIPANTNYPIQNLQKGYHSTECDLFRCSNIKETLNIDYYPLTTDEIIYAPQVTIFKNTENVQLSKVYQASFMLVVPIKSPGLINIPGTNGVLTDYSNQQEKNKMKEKINAMFHLAHKENFDCLILPDFGCQMENNPILSVIDIFNACINQYGIKYVFFYVKTENVFENIDIEKDKNFQIFHQNIKK
jgi:uncharacterized protein (TIGR02452 family)